MSFCAGDFSLPWMNSAAWVQDPPSACLQALTGMDIAADALARALARLTAAAAAAASGSSQQGLRPSTPGGGNLGDGPITSADVGAGVEADHAAQRAEAGGSFLPAGSTLAGQLPGQGGRLGFTLLQGSICQPEQLQPGASILCLSCHVWQDMLALCPDLVLAHVSVHNPGTTLDLETVTGLEAAVTISRSGVLPRSCAYLAPCNRCSASSNASCAEVGDALEDCGCPCCQTVAADLTQHLSSTPGPACKLWQTAAKRLIAFSASAAWSAIGLGHRHGHGPNLMY